ncbi:MAG: hypothetical protein LBC97_00880, partial [Bifidobacteriaceae bacterium]|nr:hypothetical protein [Bifidobacteriaceae bacterium]
TPEGSSGQWAGFTPVSFSSGAVVQGQRYPRHSDPEVHLVLGAEGVSITGPDGSGSVYYRDCVAVGAYPDGGRLLVSRRGNMMRVEPNLWAMEPAAIHQIDAAVGTGLLARLPARDPDEIPERPPPMPTVAVPPAVGVGSGPPPGYPGQFQALPPIPPRRPSTVGRVFAVFGIVAFSILMVMMLATDVMIVQEMIAEGRTAPKRAAAIFVAMIAGLSLGAVRRLVRYLRRR